MLNNVFNPLKTIWICYDTHFPWTQARVYSGLFLNRLNKHNLSQKVGLQSFLKIKDFL